MSTTTAGSDKALTKALADLHNHGAPMKAFPEKEILSVTSGNWGSQDGKYKLTKHKAESYNAAF